MLVAAPPILQSHWKLVPFIGKQGYQMNRRNRIFQDQVVVITGASSGIGRTTAICLGRHNALVVLVSRNMEKLASVRDLILENGGQAIAIQADVSHPDARSC